MDHYDFDLFTIGAGSGGVRASRVSAELGARVAVAEERHLGGTCVNEGCIPKKLLMYASHFAEAFEDAAGFGWSVGKPEHDWARLIAAKDREIARLNHVYAQLLDDAGVRRMEGTARVVDPHTVEIGGRRVTAANILIAVGAWPLVPIVHGWELGITSNEVFHLPRLPGRILVVGGGYVGVEFVGIFHGLGAHVVQIYRGPLFLRGFDDDLRAALAESLRKKIDLRFMCDVTRIERSPGGLLATLEPGGALEVDAVLFATGRGPKTRELGLEDVGVALDGNGAVVVDAYSRSSVSSIWAVGDATDRRNLTPVAIHEGNAVARTLFGDAPTLPDHRNVPSAVFSQPPVGTVGLTEEEARAAHPAIDVYRSSFRPLQHTLSGRAEQTLVKVVVDRATQRVVGCHMVGPDAGEIIQGFAVAVRCGLTKPQLDATLGIHPTSAEEFVTLRAPAPERAAG